MPDRNIHTGKQPDPPDAAGQSASVSVPLRLAPPTGHPVQAPQPLSRRARIIGCCTVIVATVLIATGAAVSWYLPPRLSVAQFLTFANSDAFPYELSDAIELPAIPERSPDDVETIRRFVVEGNACKGDPTVEAIVSGLLAFADFTDYAQASWRESTSLTFPINIRLYLFDTTDQANQAASSLLACHGDPEVNGTTSDLGVLEPLPGTENRTGLIIWSWSSHWTVHTTQADPAIASTAYSVMPSGTSTIATGAHGNTLIWLDVAYPSDQSDLDWQAYFIAAKAVIDEIARS